ncbi:MAG: magnesium transporter, partial [Planctomycetes bacterium]|nr:magnesium transporter [Planctomycetota bacterium]
FMDLSRDERVGLFKTLDHLLAGETLAELPYSVQRILLDSLDRTTQRQVVAEMPPDKAADMISKYPSRRRNEILKRIDPDKAKEIKGLLTHPEETAGALMTTEYIALKQDLSTGQALAAIRRVAADVDEVAYIYVVDDTETLLGVVTLRRLLAASDETKLSDLMNTKLIKVKTGTRERRITRIFGKYNFDAIPVVDNQNKIKGIIIFKDAIDKVLDHLAESR